MPISLHAAFVPTCRQVLASLIALVDKAEAHCTAKGIVPEVFLETRLIADMHPLGFQLLRAADHSGGAVDATRKGLFEAVLFTPEPTFAFYRQTLADADAALAEATVDEMEGWVGRDMAFAFGERRMTFTAEDYLLSFAQPNFHFHVSMVYAILRGQGLEIGKRDYLGAIRLKG